MTVTIDKNVCLACFVNDLANWHVSCVPSFSEYWSNNPYKLTGKERNALERLVPRFEAYLAANDNELWLKDLLNNNLAPEIVLDLSIFMDRFNYFYEKQAENMRQVKKFLEELGNKGATEIEATRKFYNFTGNKDLTTYLTMSYNSSKQAGGMLVEVEKYRKYAVILSFGDFKLGSETWPLENIFFHEICHSFQCTPEFEKLVAINSLDAELLTEVIHSSLWGQTGYLSQKIYGLKISKNNSSSTYLDNINSAALALNPLTKRYLNNHLTIDDAFVKEAAKVTSENFKKLT